MTIAAGFRCRNGVVLCADPEITIPGLIKFLGSKIRCNETIEGKPWLTFAGDVDFFEAVAPKLVNAITKAFRSKADPILTLEDEALLIHQRFAGESFEAETEILLCLWLGKEGAKKRSLFKISGGLVAPIKQACLGTGKIVVQGMAAEMFRSDMTTKEAALLAVFLLYEAKSNAHGCGKDSQILTLLDDGSWTTFSEREHIADPSTTEIEEEYKLFKSFLRPLLLEYGKICSKPENLERAGKQFVESLLRRRKYTFNKAVKLEEEWIDSQTNFQESEEEKEDQN